MRTPFEFTEVGDTGNPSRVLVNVEDIVTIAESGNGISALSVKIGNSKAVEYKVMEPYRDLADRFNTALVKNRDELQEDRKTALAELANVFTR